MLLTDIRDYLQLSGRVSLTQLSRHFDIPESAMQGMLEFWMGKGQLIIVDQKMTHCGSATGCSGCLTQCDGQIIYQWIQIN